MHTSRRAFVAYLGASFGVLAAPASRAQSPAVAPGERLMFGVDYYPDQTDPTLWEEDARQIAAMGLNTVRIAEFAWALMEPAEGRFDLAWLHRSVDILHRAGIGVILGTPSAAPPPWLTQKYPQVLEVNSSGMTLSTEGRRFTCPTNRTFRDLSLKVATAMANGFANTPGIIGWQIDNELTLGDSSRCFCPFCRIGFQQWLRTRYGSLKEINETWGTAFWSQIYTDFAQIPVPLPSGGPPNPGMALDYDRYQSFANVSFQAEQLAMLRRLCPRHFVTTNNVAGLDTINLDDLYRDLDFVAVDNYPSFAAIYLASQPGGGEAMTPEQTAVFIAFSLDAVRGAKEGKPFFVMEQQSGKAGQTFFSSQPAKGQLRLWAFQTVAHGAMGINFFRWDTARSGAEEYWHGLLNHDRSPSPGFDEVAATVKQLKSLGHEALNAYSASNAALLFDYNSDWALTIQPGQPKLKYLNEAISWYASAVAGGALLDIVDGLGDLSRYKVVFAPVLYVLSPAQAARIETFVAAGGTFVTGFRLGVKDEHSRIVDAPLPGLLRKVMGITVEDYAPLFAEKPGVTFTSLLKGPDATCTLWADLLHPESAEVLATYTGPDYAGKPAITVNTFGKGKAFYVGARLEPAGLARVLIAIERLAGITPPLEVPRGVEVTMRYSGTHTWLYILNHTPRPQTIAATRIYRNALSGQPVPASQVIDPYGVLVLTEV